ncbi:MAG: copper resistance protein NlpE [Limnobacter sp.]|nr:copper resistance protein NlpE [Limnobacter sp.]
MKPVQLAQRVQKALALAAWVAIMSGCAAWVGEPKKPDNVYEPPKQASSNPAYSSRNSLDWAGVYQGTLPCADCEGIKTWLLLYRDMSYVLKTQYLGKQDEPLKELGSFSWDESGNSIVLGSDPARGARFAVQERRLVQTNSVGQVINPERADDYVLKQVARLKAGQGR